MKVISEFSLYYLIFVFLFAFALSLTLYYKNQRNSFSKKILFLLFTLRFLSTSLIGSLLLSPMILFTSYEKEKPSLLLLYDNSESMISGSDSSYFKSKFEKEIEDFKEIVGDKFQIEEYSLADDLKNGFPTFTASKTDLAASIMKLSNRYKYTKSLTTLLFSDGIINAGSNPTYAANSLSFPLNTLAFGDTNSYLDAYIKNVNYNDISFLGNSFPVELTVGIEKAKNSNCYISIFENDKLLEKRLFTSNSDAYEQKFNWIFKAKTIGLQKYSIEISGLKNEKNIQNNRTSFYVDVLNSKQKIALIYQAPHPDINALKQSIETYDDFEVSTFSINTFNENTQAYSLIILHQLPSTRKSIDVIKQAINAKIPLLFILGEQTNLASFNALNLGFKINSTQIQTIESEAITETGFSLFQFEDEFINQVQDYPPLSCLYGSYQVSPEYISMFNQRIGAVATQLPLITLNSNSEHKKAFILGTGIWQWRIRDFLLNQNHVFFNTFIEKTIRYLSLSDDKSRFTLDFQKQYSESDRIIISAKLLNPSYELVKDALINLTLTNEKGKSFNHQFIYNGINYELDLGNLPFGKYSIMAKAKNGSENFVARGVFVVNEWNVEKANLKANHQMLKSIAYESGGKMYFKNDFKKIANDLLQNETLKTVRYPNEKITDIIDLLFVLLAAIALLVVEWFLRKHFGNY